MNRAHILICPHPSDDFTEKEVEAIEEFILMLKEQRKAGEDDQFEPTRDRG